MTGTELVETEVETLGDWTLEELEADDWPLDLLLSVVVGLMTVVLVKVVEISEVVWVVTGDVVWTPSVPVPVLIET